MIPLIWDNKEEWNSPPPKFGSAYGLAFEPKVFIDRPEDNPVEAARLYKENHNSARANQEWKWLDDFCGRVYGAYCKYVWRMK